MSTTSKTPLGRPALRFRPDHGASFKREMAEFIEKLRRDIPSAFESRKYLDAKAKLHDDIDAEKPGGRIMLSEP